MSIRIIKSLLVCLGVYMMLPCTVWAAGDACRDIGFAGECDLFKADIQVQPMVAEQLIRLALDDDNVTFGEYTNKTVGDDTYEVTDSAGAKHVFWFDDLQDSKSGAVSESTAKAVCLLNGGSLDDSYRCMRPTTPDKLAEDVKSFEMVADCKCKNGCVGETVQAPYCKISVKRIMANGKLNDFSYNGVQIIDPNVFSEMQIVSTGEVTEYLRDYVMIKLVTNGLIMDAFGCSSRPMSYSDGSMSVDDVLRCTVRYRDSVTQESKTQNIDFIFDDMYEYGKKAASAGRAGLVCNAQGGSATSKGACAGFTQEMCTAIAKEHNIDTRWEPEAGGCIMTSAADYAETQKSLAVTGAVAGLAIGILTLPVGGGVATVAMIGGIMTVISTGVSMGVAKKIDAAFTSAILGANQCLIKSELCAGTALVDNELVVKNRFNKECIKCANQSVSQVIEAVIAFNGEYSKTDADAAAYLIDVLSSVENGTMQPVCIEEYASNIEKSPLVTTKQVADAAMLIGVVLSLGGGVYAKATSANAESVLDKVIKGAKNFKTAKANIEAVEVLADAGRMQALMSRTQKTYKSFVNIISEYKRLRGVENLSKSTLSFVDRVASFSDMYDGTGAGGNIYDAWTAAGCTKDFPCSATVAEFVDPTTLDAMCIGGGQI